jgi:chemotaxis protein MotB
MAARKAMGGRRRRHGGEEEESSERWLLTYADMITLLMALFMVLFSISSVNISKYRTLQQALKDAFSGQIFPGGKALEKTGATSSASKTPNATASTSVLPFSLEPAAKSLRVSPVAAPTPAQQEQEDFQHLKREIEAYASHHGLNAYVKPIVERRGLVIELLTDKLLFPSGAATLTPASFPLLEKIASLLQIDRVHPIAVEGNTDDVPIDTAAFPSNWELSTARASSIVEFFASHGVAPGRMSAIGYARSQATRRRRAGPRTGASRSCSNVSTRSPPAPADRARRRRARKARSPSTPAKASKEEDERWASCSAGRKSSYCLASSCSSSALATR